MVTKAHQEPNTQHRVGCIALNRHFCTLGYEDPILILVESIKSSAKSIALVWFGFESGKVFETVSLLFIPIGFQTCYLIKIQKLENI